MPYTDESDLKYIESLDDLPSVGSFSSNTWTTDEKLRQAEAGETKLEADVNEGSTIQSPESIHAEAAAAWATYKLVLGMKSPDSTTRGDSLDEGTDRMEFADRVKKMYKSYTNSIASADSDEGSGSGGPGNVGFEVADW